MKAAVNRYFQSLGLPGQYFAQTQIQTIAKHVESLQGATGRCLVFEFLPCTLTLAHPLRATAAAELARSSGKQFEVELQQEEPTTAFFAARSIVAMVRRGGAFCP